MTRLLLIFLSLLFFGCSQNKTDEATSESHAEQAENQLAKGDFDWVLGAWKRTNDDAGRQTYERWKKVNEDHYEGLGFTLEGTDTVSQENMQFIKKNQEWTLSVNTPSQPEAVTFRMVRLSEKDFTFENPANDFPKIIKYWKEGDSMKASVSNAEFTIDFVFEKADPLDKYIQ